MEADGSLVIKGIRVEAKVLQKKAVRRCADGNCIAACCSGGVWLNDDEPPRIREWAQEIKACLPPERHDESQWFESREDDEDALGTNTVDDPLRSGETCCVFLQSDRKCALQVVSQENNLGWPGIKPYYCAIYPLYLEGDVLTTDDETPFNFEGSTCHRAASESRPVYDLYRDEAILVLGEDGYKELQERAEER